MKKTLKSGFSLIELLVALSILAVVAAIIVPKFLGIGKQAAVTAAMAQLQQLKSTYNQFLSLGGSGSISSSDVLGFLTLPPSTTQRTDLCTNAFGTSKDSSGGQFGSSTVSLSATVNYTGATFNPVADPGYTAGFWCSNNVATPTKNSYYLDGQGHGWAITTSLTGDVTATAAFGGIDINGGTTGNAITL